MSWSDFIKKNFQLILAAVGVLFYGILLRRQRKQGETIDSLRTELALNEAKQKVSELSYKQKDNTRKLDELKKEKQNIVNRLKKLAEEDTSVDLEGEDLAKFLTEELSDGYGS